MPQQLFPTGTLHNANFTLAEHFAGLTAFSDSVNRIITYRSIPYDNSVRLSVRPCVTVLQTNALPRTLNRN